VAPASDKRFTPDDRLPDGALGAAHLRDVFYRMGFDDREIVALSGAHAVGRCHTDRSGFWGPWKYGENAFSNEYYTFLLEKTWTPKTTHGAPSAHCPVAGSWKGPMQYEAPMSRAPRLHFGCTSPRLTSAALRMHLGCTSNALRMHIGCTSYATSVGTSDAPRMHFDCTLNAPRLCLGWTSAPYSGGAGEGRGRRA